jgi:outer membrane protein TolC
LLLDAQQTALMLTADAYYTVLQAERSVVVDENSLAEQEERVRQATAQLNAGNGTRLAVAQSESEASATRVSLIQAQAAVATSRAALGLLIGIPLGDRPLTDQYDPPTDELRPVEEWLADADAHRQDLIAAAVAVEAARQGVRAAIAEYIPTVTLGITHTIYVDGSRSLQQPWSLALSANIPIFTGGAIEADVRTAFSNLRIAVLKQSQTRKTVEEEIRTDYAALVRSRRQVRELKVELAASRDALVYAQQQFNVGLAINLDVLTAQDNLLSTQLALATQEYQEKIAYLDLLRVDGQLTFAAAAPPQRPSTEPSDMEFTTPNVVQYTTAPSTMP